MSRNVSPVAVLFVGGLWIATVAAAQRVPATETSTGLAMSQTMSPGARSAMEARIDAVNTRFREEHGGHDPSEFGLQCCQITQIPAAAFSLRDPANFSYSFTGPGYMYLSSGSITSVAQFWAPVTLPTGALVSYLDLYYWDNNPSFNMEAYLVALTGGTGNVPPPDVLTVATAVSTGSIGYGYASSPITLYTVNNNVAYDPNGAQLIVLVHSNQSNINFQFKAVDIWWLRQVSPAPGSATFTDVQTSHPFFQFVEALAAAGITAGYPDGRFGVDDPITRGQMAVFLSKALGLYWPF